MAPTPQQIAEFLASSHLFRDTPLDKLEEVGKCFSVVERQAEEIIVKQGERSEFFYLVYSGQLKMIREQSRRPYERDLGFLNAGDFFSMEAMESNRACQSTVQAVAEVTLLALDRDGARRVIELVPAMTWRFNLDLSSYNLVLRRPFPWVNPEEYICYAARKHPIFLVVRLLPWLVLGFPLLGLAIGAIPLHQLTLFLLILVFGGLFILAGLAWNAVDWANDYYIVTIKRVAYQERVVLLYDSRLESPVEQIQSISVDSSYIGRILNYGNVTIRTFIGTIVFRAVKQPQDVVLILQEMQARAQSSLYQAELKEIRETLRKRLAEEPPPTPKPRPAPPPNTLARRIQRFMADLFHLRYEHDDVIQYRTHWFVLLRRIFLPVLVQAALAGIGIWILVGAFTGRLVNGPVTTIFMLLCIAGLGAFLWGLYNYLDWHNDIYVVSNDQVLDINRKPLGQEEKRAAQIRNILSVEYQRLGIIGLVLNFGTVYIRVGEATFTFDDVFNPSEVQRDLLHRISQRNLRERQAQAEAERKRLADWFYTYHNLANSLITLSSPMFENGKPIPLAYTSAGENISPALNWSGTPGKTMSFALIMETPDVPGGTRVHWVVYNLPSGTTSLPERASAAKATTFDLPAGTHQGLNSFGRNDYNGPCQPEGKQRYFFTLYALNIRIDVPGLDKAGLLKAMEGYIVTRGELLGVFGETPEP